MNNQGKIMKLDKYKADLAALYLRVGLGVVFVIGGVSKLSHLLGSTSDKMVSSYMGSSGYINQLFQDFLFSNDVVTPWGFLTSLSAFELVSGICLISGFIVRPLALIYSFLLWTFIVSLPVETVPQITSDVKTYTSPAMFVQIRDITLSGLMFVLYNLGSGSRSLDNKYGLNMVRELSVNWDILGLLSRFSLGLTFIVGGFFGAYSKVPTFNIPQALLLAVGLVLIFGSNKFLKVASTMTVAIMLYYISIKLTLDKGIIANLNGFKREFAFIFASIVLFQFGGGNKFTFKDVSVRTKNYFFQTNN